jgi:hypothetical protein
MGDIRLRMERNADLGTDFRLGSNDLVNIRASTSLDWIKLYINFVSRRGYSAVEPIMRLWVGMPMYRQSITSISENSSIYISTYFW